MALFIQRYLGNLYNPSLVIINKINKGSPVLKYSMCWLHIKKCRLSCLCKKIVPRIPAKNIKRITKNMSLISGIYSEVINIVIKKHDECGLVKANYETMCNLSI